MEITGDQPTDLRCSLAAENLESVTNSMVAMTISAGELSLIEALRRGDEAAFLLLVEQFHATMIRIARNYVINHAVAEEVVQETWIGVLRGLDRFECRSSLKTWIFRILINQSKLRATHEARWITFSDEENFLIDEPAVDPDCFQADGWWRFHPSDWDNGLERRVLWQETYACIQQVIQVLPPNQRTVMILRDIEGWPAPEVCETLHLSEENQRVLLHRARSKVRRTLEQYFATNQQAKQGAHR